MNASIEEGKAALLKVHAKVIQQERGTSFARAWQLALEAHPDLAETFPDQEHPTSQPAYQPPPPGKVAADQVKLEKLLKKYMSGSRRIEADKKDDDGELMLVMASSGEIVDLVLE